MFTINYRTSFNLIDALNRKFKNNLRDREGEYKNEVHSFVRALVSTPRDADYYDIGSFFFDEKGFSFTVGLNGHMEEKDLRSWLLRCIYLNIGKNIFHKR